MAGYTRQSTASIVAGLEVQANPLNAEFNALQGAFNSTTGHTHDGSIGNGVKIDLTASVSQQLPVANGGTGSSTAAGARTNLFGVSTTVDNTIARYEGTTGALQSSGVIISDSNAVSGIVGLSTTSGGSLLGTWSSMGTVTTIDINGGTIDSTVIGGGTPSSGAFTTITGTTANFTNFASANASFTGPFELTGDLVQLSEGGTGASDAATARANLGVEPLPPGMVVAYAMITPPTGWLECTGGAVSRTTYANLFTAIGETYGVGDGSTTFNLPDLRAEFIRGLDSSRGVDAGRAIGTAQAAATLAHTHTGTTDTSGAAHTHTFSDTSSAGGTHSHNVSGNTGYVSADHQHNFADTSGNGSANHTHAFTDIQPVFTGSGSTSGTSSEYIPQSNAEVTGGSGAAHTHAIGGTTSNITVNHYHAVSGTAAAVGNHTHAISGTTATGSANHTHTFTTAASVGTETRPRNVAMIYCIKT